MQWQFKIFFRPRQEMSLIDGANIMAIGPGGSNSILAIDLDVGPTGKYNQVFCRQKVP